MRLRLRAGRARLGEDAARLDGLSPLAVLRRGYAIATDRDGRVVRGVEEVVVGQSLGVRLHRGSLDATVTGVRAGPPGPDPTRREPRGAR